MNVFFHPDFYQVYTSDPAADPGRMEAIVQAIESEVTFITPNPANEEDLRLVHPQEHIDWVKKQGLYEIAALAAGGAIEAAVAGLNQPSFGLIRPPGHHASANSCWGFCYFNNMAVAVMVAMQKHQVRTACILDIDMHYGDGTDNILGHQKNISIFNPETNNRNLYLKQVEKFMANCNADLIGISAGFDNHIDDWGGVLHTSDYFDIGCMVARSARQNQGGCFGVLEGGYNHAVLGQNVRALIQGLSSCK